MSCCESVKDYTNCLLVLVEEDLGDEGVGHHVQVRAISCLAEKCLRRGAATTASNGGLWDGESVLIWPVDVNVWIA